MPSGWLTEMTSRRYIGEASSVLPWTSIALDIHGFAFPVPGLTAFDSVTSIILLLMSSFGRA